MKNAQNYTKMYQIEGKITFCANFCVVKVTKINTEVPCMNKLSRNHIEAKEHLRNGRVTSMQLSHALMEYMHNTHQHKLDIIWNKNQTWKDSIQACSPKLVWNLPNLFYPQDSRHNYVHTILGRFPSQVCSSRFFCKFYKYALNFFPKAIEWHFKF